MAGFQVTLHGRFWVITEAQILLSYKADEFGLQV
jgi:hypothetical protein